MTLYDVPPIGMPVRRFDLEPGSTYSLEIAAHLAGVSRRNILLYCKSGLVRPIVQQPFGAFLFDDEAIHNMRRVEHLRTVCGINLQGRSFSV